jgi:tape measure domain-containing protein
MATVSIDVIAKDSFSGVLGNFGSIITGIESAINLAGQAFQVFAGFAMEGLEAVASYERLSLALTTLNASQLIQAGTAKDMAAAMDVSAIKAEELLGWMQDLAIHSPFTLDGVAQAFRLAMAYGFTADEAQRLTQAFIDFSAGTGASEYNMQLIARAMGQISTAGKLMGQDMLQLTSAGLPVAQILADAFGVSTAEIIKMREKGLLPAKEVIEALTVYMETNYKGAADNFSTSWAGLMGTFEDLKQMGLREFFTGLFDAVQPLAIAFAEWAQGPGLTLLGTLGDMLGTWASSMVGDLEKLAPVMGTINQAIMQFSNLIDNDWAPLQALHKVLSDLAIVWEGTPLGNLMDTLATFVEDADKEGLGTAFGNLFSGVGDSISDAFMGIVESPETRSTIQRFINVLSEEIDKADWSAVSRTLAEVIGTAARIAFGTLAAIVTEIDWAPLGVALQGAMKELVRGWFSAWGINLDYSTFSEIGKDIFNGIILGLTQNPIVGPITNVVNGIINTFKRLLGIASPSTVFRQIGIDIIQGLINGIDFMLGPLDEIVTGVFDLLTGGGEGRTGGATGDATGLLGGGSSTIGGGGTSGVLMGGTVTNIYNFYGTTYVSGAGPAGTYDCAPTISSGGMIPAGVR